MVDLMELRIEKNDTAGSCFFGRSAENQGL